MSYLVTIDGEELWVHTREAARILLDARLKAVDYVIEEEWGEKIRQVVDPDYLPYDPREGF